MQKAAIAGGLLLCGENQKLNGGACFRASNFFSSHAAVQHGE
jgi:hypothetical protein